MFVGVDYGSKQAGTTSICYVKEQKIYFEQSEKKKDADQFLIGLLAKLQPIKWVFFDAPLSLPAVYQDSSIASPNYFYRKCDREIKAMSPMFIGGLTARAIKLSHTLTDYEFIEAYPGGLARDFEYDKLGYKTSPDHIAKLTKLVVNRYKLEIAEYPANWHQFDSLLCFIIGIRYQNNECKVFGEISEGQIYV